MAGMTGVGSAPAMCYSLCFRKLADFLQEWKLFLYFLKRGGNCIKTQKKCFKIFLFLKSFIIFAKNI